MRKDLKKFVWIFGALCFLFLGFLIISINIAFRKNLSYDFSAVVDSVRYDEKGTPIIIINHNEYTLSAGYNFDYQIQKGDILRKQKGFTTYTLIKQKTGKVMVFKN